MMLVVVTVFAFADKGKLLKTKTEVLSSFGVKKHGVLIMRMMMVAHCRKIKRD